MSDREILFRAKRADNGEWIYGDRIVEPYGVVIQYYRDNKRIKAVIIPETLGQYTGLTDENGQQIFEGDILKYTNEDDEAHYIKVVFEDCAFLIEDDGITDCDLLTSYICLGLKLGGNIHDNPELLEANNEQH